MILEDALYSPEVNVHGEGREFDFMLDSENEGMIFSLLRDKMYPNPIKAIAREVASNARDANREAGAGDMPIEVELVQNDPLFNTDYSIVYRDNGVGIDEDRLRYITGFGSSTKRDSNDETGGFGLGAKCPFSYTDTWKIVTNPRGTDETRTYMLYIDESNKGKAKEFSALRKGPSDFSTEIHIPISKEDVEAFYFQTVFATMFWKVTPKLIGFKNVNGYVDKSEGYPDGYPYFRDTFGNRSNGYEFVEADYTSWQLRRALEKELDGSKIIIVMDGIAYPYNNQLVTDDIDIREQRYSQSNFLVLYFETGEINPQPHRDRLRPDDKTISAISKRLKRVIKENMTDVVDKYFADAKDVYEAMKIANDINGGKYIHDWDSFGSDSEQVKKDFNRIKAVTKIINVDPLTGVTWKGHNVRKLYGVYIDSHYITVVSKDGTVTRNRDDGVRHEAVTSLKSSTYFLSKAKQMEGVEVRYLDGRRDSRREITVFQNDENIEYIFIIQPHDFNVQSLVQKVKKDRNLITKMFGVKDYRDLNRTNTESISLESDPIVRKYCRIFTEPDSHLYRNTSSLRDKVQRGHFSDAVSVHKNSKTWADRTHGKFTDNDLLCYVADSLGYFDNHQRMLKFKKVLMTAVLRNEYLIVVSKSTKPYLSNCDNVTMCDDIDLDAEIKAFESRVQPKLNKLESSYKTTYNYRSALRSLYNVDGFKFPDADLHRKFEIAVNSEDPNADLKTDKEVYMVLNNNYVRDAIDVKLPDVEVDIVDVIEKEYPLFKTLLRGLSRRYNTYSDQDKITREIIRYIGLENNAS